MGLFDNLNPGQSAPAAGGGLFGAATPAASTATGPSLFGNLGSNSQAPPKPSLFAQTTSAPAAGGLFGASAAAPAQPAQSGGLFGRVAPAPLQIAPAGGLFGKVEPKAPQAGGLFGGLGATATSQPAAGGGLFGSLGASTAPPAASSGLFGGLGASTAQPAAGSSLFGGAGTSVAQQPAAGSSLFAGINTAQQPAQASAPAGSTQSAYFDQLLERGKKRNTQEQGGFGDMPSLQLGLGDIARKVRNLGTGGPSAQQQRAGDTRAHYLLAASGVSTASALRDLSSFSAQAGAIPPPSASGATDADIDAFISNMHAQSTLALINEGFEQAKRDFDAFLEENVQMNWDAQRRKIYEHFGLAKPSNRTDEDLGGSFGETTKGAFGRSSRRTRAMGTSMAASGGVSFGPTGMTRSVLGNSSMRNTLRMSAFGDAGEKTSAGGLQAGIEDRMQRDKQQKYAEKVKELNVARNQENAYPLIHGFADVEEQAGVDNTAALADSYNALISIISEPSAPLRKAEHGAVKERQFRDDYLSDNLQQKGPLALRQQIINGSRSYLEQVFWKRLETAIAKEQRVANLGGIPLPINKIRGYIRVLEYRKQLFSDPEELQSIKVDDSTQDYPWALIYYLLRCGLVTEASKYVSELPKSISSIGRNFSRALDEYAESPDRRLSPEVRKYVMQDFAQQKLGGDNSLDKYKHACYKIVGRCELGRRTLDGKNLDEEDWLWLQFALAREVSRVEENAGEVFGLEQLQQVVHDIGQRHFVGNTDSTTGVGTFFFMQILAGMFEQAIAWLYPRNHIAAVHFAIALDYYGLLRVADLTASELLSFTTTQKPQINFALMIGYYTADFRAAKPETAVDYLVLLCLNSDLAGEAGRRQADICYEALRELALETREFAQLLGDVRSDGQRIPGAIQHRLKLIRTNDDKTLEDNNTFLRTLTMQAASAADDSGRTTDAVLLYHLAEEYDTVVQVINRCLSEALSVPPGQEPLRLEPLKPRNDQAPPANGTGQQQANSTLSLTSVSDPLSLSRNMMSLYSEGSIAYRSIKRTTKESSNILQHLALAKSKLEAQQFLQALQAIEAVDMLPLTANGNMAQIRQYAQDFSKWPEVVARVVGDVLMWTIACCGRERERLRNSEFEDRVKTQQAELLLQAARDLMIYAGLIKYKLPPRVFEALARAGQDVGV